MLFTIIIINYRYLECIQKHTGCNAKGEMFKGENDEWLFVLNSSHNHLSNEDHSMNE